VGDVDHERLSRLLGDPALAWLLDRVRHRIEHGTPLAGPVTLKGASAAQRDAAERLLGRRPRAGRALTVSLTELDELLRRSRLHRDGLAAAVTVLTGPVSVRAEARAVERAAWDRAFAGLSEVVLDKPELANWFERLRNAGVVKRLAPDPVKARVLLDGLAIIVATLPGDGEPLGSFAARVAGSAHALDEGEPLGTLALSAARALAGLEPPGPDESPAESRREAWAAVGLMCDELSNLVLTIGLPGDGRTGTGRILHVAQASGQPLWLTLRQLVRDPPRWADASVPSLAGLPVHACENPAIVALAADRLGCRCPPLVCVNGQPRAATLLLLRSLVAAGAHLLHHGDFDWGGVRIGNVLHSRLPVAPWQFDEESYVRAAARFRSSLPLAGDPAEASWDPALSDAMRRVGLRIEEELVAGELLATLESVAADAAWSASPARIAPAAHPVVSSFPNSPQTAAAPDRYQFR
jgi:uncharacterized protein (TIGR02679 family)